MNWEAPKLRETLAAFETDEQRAAFKRLVEEAEFAAVKRGWHPIRQWAVLADLIRDGWRPTK